MLWNRLAQPLTSCARQGLYRPLRTNPRILQCVPKRCNSSNPQNTGQYTPDPTDQNDGEEEGRGRKNDDPNLKSTILKMMETAATTAASIAILG